MKFTNKFVSWFSSCCLNDVKHPIFGKHQVTPEQVKYSNGEYKRKIFKCIIKNIISGNISEEKIKEKS